VIDEGHARAAHSGSVSMGQVAPKAIDVLKPHVSLYGGLPESRPASTELSWGTPLSTGPAPLSTPVSPALVAVLEARLQALRA